MEISVLGQSQFSSDMRVIISGHLPPPYGGMATYYQSLLHSSIQTKVNLLFVQTSTQNRDLSKSGRMSSANILNTTRDIRQFFKSIIKFRPDITHIGTAYGLSFLKHSLCVIIARLFGSRVLLHPHCSYLLLYENRSKLWQGYFRMIIGLCDGIITLSEEWFALSNILHSTRIFYLPNGIDLTDYIAIAQDRSLCNTQNEDPCLLYLGYVGKAKGSFDLIEAINKLIATNPNIQINIVGDELSPGEKSQLENRVTELGLEKHIHIFPGIYGSDKYEFFRNADIFIYPSYHEGMPIAVIEAMACGLPTIATNVGGLPDLVMDQKNGILVEPGNPEQLATAVVNMLSDQVSFKNMQMYATKFAIDNYDIELHVTRLVDIYKNVLGTAS